MRVTADDALGSGFTDILVATGALWRGDGVGRWHTSAIPLGLAPLSCSRPMTCWGAIIRCFFLAPRRSRVLVFDDDHYYLGGALAELLAGLGHQVRLVTPAPLVSSWTANTLEIGDVQRRVLGAGIVVSANQVLVAVGAGEARTACAFTGTETVVAADAGADGYRPDPARRPVSGAGAAAGRVAGPRRPVGAVRGRRVGSVHDRLCCLGGPALRRGTRHAGPAVA